MDTFIKILGNNNAQTTIAASKFGFDNLMFKAADILIRKLKGESISNEDSFFLKENFTIIAPGPNEEFEFVIDKMNQEIYNNTGFEIYDLDVFKPPYDLNITKTVTFDKIELFFKEKLSFDEFLELYTFLKKLFCHKFVILNDKYLYRINSK